MAWRRALLAGLFAAYAGAAGMGGGLWAVWYFGPALPASAPVEPLCSRDRDLYVRVEHFPGVPPHFDCFLLQDGEVWEAVHRRPTPGPTP